MSYKDHCDNKVVEHLDFTDHTKAISFLLDLEAEGGGDPPEAVFDGLD